MINHNIVRFNITMHDTFWMTEIQSLNCFFNDAIPKYIQENYTFNNSYM